MNNFKSKISLENLKDLSRETLQKVMQNAYRLECGVSVRFVYEYIASVANGGPDYKCREDSIVKYLIEFYNIAKLFELINTLESDYNFGHCEGMFEMSLNRGMGPIEKFDSCMIDLLWDMFIYSLEDGVK